MAISKCYRLPQNGLLPTTSSSCHCLEKHWRREAGVCCFTTNRPRCCPRSVLPTLRYGRHNLVLSHAVPNQYCNMLCLHDRTRCQSTGFSTQAA